MVKRKKNTSIKTCKVCKKKKVMLNYRVTCGKVCAGKYRAMAYRRRK